MPAVITSPPVLVATASADFSGQNARLVNAFVGPQLQIGANRYAALTALGGAPPAFQAFKSADSGATWNLMDDVDSPNVGNFPLYKVTAAADGLYYVWEGDGSGSVANRALGYAKFDPNTDTWGATTQTPADTESTFSNGYQIARRSNGDIVVIFPSQTPADGNVQWGVFAAGGGAWSGASDFNTALQQFSVLSAVTGPDDTVHVLLCQGISSLSGQGDVYYQSLSPTNVVSAPVLIGTLGAGTPDSFFDGQPWVDTTLDQILFPFMDIGQTHTSMFVGSPIAAPAWTQQTLETGLPAGTYSYPIAFRPDSGPFVIFQIVDSNGPLFQIWQTPWDGTNLGTPVLFYDGVANAPAGGPIDELIKPSASQVSGAYDFLVAMQLTPGFPPENTYSLSAPSISIDCGNPPDGIVGKPYSHAFPVTGGTPPLTFAIIAGSLPPGLTLNTSTGVVSGIPTAYGTYSFTIGVTGS